MKVKELIERLEDFEPDHEVRIAIQPSWPLQSTVRDVVSSEDVYDFNAESGGGDSKVVWVVEGSQVRDPSPYAPSGVFEVAR